MMSPSSASGNILRIVHGLRIARPWLGRTWGRLRAPTWPTAFNKRESRETALHRETTRALRVNATGQLFEEWAEVAVVRSEESARSISLKFWVEMAAE
jgi:hypothetical protein